MSTVKEHVGQRPLTFCRDVAALLAADKTPRYIKSLRLTNSVLHGTTKQLAKKRISVRDMFWGGGFDEPGANDALEAFSNDTCKGPNYRLDTTRGRILSFCKVGNHIRAGPSSPATAVLSMYEYHACILNTNAGTASYPSRIVVPNVVSTGTFSGNVRADIHTLALVSSNAKFPGSSVSLSTRSTPMIYTKCNKKKKGVNGRDGRSFILPGLTTARQAFDSIKELESIVRPPGAT
jgi:hypothetical protein